MCNYPHAFLKKQRGYCNRLGPSILRNGPLLGTLKIRNYAFWATFSNTVSTQQVSNCKSVCPLCYLLLNHWTKFNQIWYVSYSHEWGVQWQFFFLAPPPGRGQKVKYLISITKSISKIFIPNFVCILTCERYKSY